MTPQMQVLIDLGRVRGWSIKPAGHPHSAPLPYCIRRPLPGGGAAVDMVPDTELGLQRLLQMLGEGVQSA